MRDDNGIEPTIAESPKIWQGIFAFFLRMHSAIEDEPLTGSLQIIAIGADFGAAREVDELQILILALTRALALPLRPNSRARLL